MEELCNSVIVVFLVLVAQPLGADGRVVLGSQFLLIVYSILTVISCIAQCQCQCECQSSWKIRSPTLRVNVIVWK